MNITALANGSSMEGANSYTLGLFQSSKALQAQMMSQMNSNSQDIAFRNAQMQSQGKGMNINISV